MIMGGIRTDLGAIKISHLDTVFIESISTISVVEEDDNGMQKDVLYHRLIKNISTHPPIWVNSFMEKVNGIEYDDLEKMYNKRK